jgi:hypothetical protein
MNDDSARSRVALLGQTWPCAHSCSRAEEALELAVPAWCVGRDEDVAGAELGQRAREQVALGVALGVVGHDRFERAAALFAHPGRGALERDRSVDGVLGAVQLGVDEEAVAVLDSDHDRLADVARTIVLVAIASHSVPGL